MLRTEFFDAEMTWLLGRDLERWDNKVRKACLYKAPTPFVTRILEGCIGDNDRGGCEFATHMHSVIDTLMEQFRQLGDPRERDEMLRAVCHAFATRPWQRELFKWRSADSWSVPRNWESLYRNPIPTAFVVAIHARYDNVIKHMLDIHPTVPCDISTGVKCRLASANTIDLGLPIDMAVISGQTREVERLWDHVAQQDIIRPRQLLPTSTALEVAARRGHFQVLELIFPRLFSSELSEQDVLHMVGKAIRMAARHQQWHVARPLIEEYAQLTEKYNMQEYADSCFCFAARDGQDDVVDRLVEWVKLPTHGFPLREAAGGGHLSTCKLLLRKGSRPEPLAIRQQSEVFARAVARGGNVQVCELLRPHGFWSENHEIHFLPIAAELGHLELAKYAVANGCDRKPPMQRLASVIPELERKVQYPDDIRSFALLRAIVSGHEDVVRWMLDELGMEIGSDAELTHPELRPWHLAAHANTRKKLTLALGFDPNVETCDGEEGREDCKMTVVKTLDEYQQALRLRREDYNREWCKHRDGHV